MLWCSGRTFYDWRNINFIEINSTVLSLQSSNKATVVKIKINEIDCNNNTSKEYPAYAVLKFYKKC